MPASWTPAPMLWSSVSVARVPAPRSKQPRTVPRSAWSTGVFCGGATAVSGGVFCGCGGTDIQKEAGVEDSAEDMFRYLEMEVGDAVTSATLRQFCEGSGATAGCFQEHGVPFQASLCPIKTSYPSNAYYLYYSGNESFAPFKDAARPAARGHRAVGTGLPGANFYEPLRAAALSAGAVPLYQSRAQRLVVDAGRVVGVEVASLEFGWHATRHPLLAWLALKINPYQPKLAKRLRKRLVNIERKHARTKFIQARGGVILAAGGFIYNREMVQ
jgi:3-oxo-5alpha-steroid 4-dehydrogenase